MTLNSSSFRRLANLYSLLAFLFFSGPILLCSASTIRNPPSPFPVLFEQSETEWIARGPGYQLTVAGAGATLAVRQSDGPSEMLRMTLVGARTSARPQPELLSAGHRNYLIGSNRARWRRNVPLWSRLRISRVLPGVDLVFYGRGSFLEYDLILDPGVDPAIIQVRYSGAHSVRINPEGDLVFHNATLDFLQRRPTAYQQIAGVRRLVPASFQLDHGVVRFAVDTFDHAHALVIDPGIDYATYVGGSGYEEIRAIAADTTSAAYLAGSAATPTIPVTVGAYKKSCGNDGLCDSSSHPTAGPNRDTFIAKFSSDGSTLEYATYLGGGGDDYPVSIAVDTAGNAYIGGTTTSADFPVTSQAYVHTYSLPYHSFLTKLSADGSSLVWSTLLPSNLRDIGIDAAENVYFLANPQVPDLATTPNAQPSHAAVAPYLGKLDSSGSHLVYATYLEGRYIDNQGCGLAVTSDGEAWVAGSSGGNLFLEYGPCQLPNPETLQSDGLLYGIDTNSGHLLNASTWTSKGQTAVIDVARDGSGNLYVSGYSPDFPGIDKRLLDYYGLASFVAKLSAANATRQWTKTFPDYVNYLKVDGQGRSAFFSKDASLGQEPFVNRFVYLDPAGTTLWSVINPGSASALAIDKMGRLYTSPNPGTTTNAWLSNPAAGKVGMTGFMRIDPLGGSLVVLPTQMEAAVGQQLIIGSDSDVPFSAPYTVTTATPWLRVVNPSGTTSRITDSAITTPTKLYADTSALSVGVHDGSVTVTSPAFANSPLSIPVRLTIPLTVTDKVIPQEVVLVGDQDSELSPLDQFPSVPALPPGATVTTQTPWIKVTGAAVTAKGAGLPKGINTGQISIDVPGKAGSPFNVIVTFVITSDSGPTVCPAELNFNIRRHDLATVSATIAVSPASVRSLFPLRVETNVPWLQASPASASDYALITLTANPTGLQPGLYAGDATITQVSTELAAPRKVRVPVRLTIGDTPFSVAPAALAVMFSPASNPQDLTLALHSSQPLPFDFSIGSQNASQSGTMPSKVTFQVQVDSCPNDAVNGCEIGTVVQPLAITSGTTALRVPLTVVTRPLLPSIGRGGIVNGATFQAGAVAPGSILAVFGTELSRVKDVAPGAAPLPFRFDPSFETVSFQNSLGGFVAPRFFYAFPTQLGLQVPWEMPLGPNALRVSYDKAWGAGQSQWEPFEVAAVAPYIFIWGDHRGAVQNSDYTLNQPSNPAAAESPIVVYLTGQGMVDPPVPTGAPSPAKPLSRVRERVTATIDGQPADVQFAGLTPGFAGLCQVNLTVPANIAPGEHQLVITIGGVATNTVAVSTK